MERIIAKLLQQFESGKLAPRQPIRSLAMAATAAGAAHAEAEGIGLQAVGVNHISCLVAVYTKTRDFYADLFGMKVSKDNGKKCCLSSRDGTASGHGE